MEKIDDGLKALLEQGKTEKEAGVSFGKPVTLTRTSPPQPGFGPDATSRIFQADAAKLPTYLGAANERGGYSIYKLVEVNTPPVGDTQRLAAANTQLGQQIGRELLDAYITTLKSRADVKVNQSALEKK